MTHTPFENLSPALISPAADSEVAASRWISVIINTIVVGLVVLAALATIGKQSTTQHRQTPQASVGHESGNDGNRNDMNVTSTAEAAAHDASPR